MKGRAFSTVLMVLMLNVMAKPNMANAQVTIPKSNRYFTGDITFLDGSKVSFEIREGSLLTVRTSATAAKYGIVFLRAEGSAKLKFIVLQLQSDRVSGSLPSQEFELKRSFVVEQSPAITIKVDTIGEKRFPNPPSSIQDPSIYLTETCCSTFKGKELCANSAAFKDRSAKPCRFDK